MLKTHQRSEPGAKVNLVCHKALGTDSLTCFNYEYHAAALAGKAGRCGHYKVVMKSLNSLIGKTTRTAIQQDRRIRQLISQIVPARALAHIEFCRLEGGRLRLTVDSAAWVSKLRFSERQIISALRQEKLDAHTISVHVSPAEKPTTRVTLRKPNETSEQAAIAIHKLAESALADDQGPAFRVEEHTNGRRLRSAESLAKSRSCTSGSGDKLRQELLKLAEKLRNS